MHLILILLAAASQAAETPAPSTPAPDQPVAEQPVAELPEIIVTCRTQRVTGTRMIKKICRTPAQQRQADLDARNKLRLGTQVQTTEAFKRPRGE
jgi:hypothetical protein